MSIIYIVFVSGFIERSLDGNLTKDKEAPAVMLEEFVSKVTHPRHYSQLGSLAPIHVEGNNASYVELHSARVDKNKDSNILTTKRVEQGCWRPLESRQR